MQSPQPLTPPTVSITDLSGADIAYLAMLVSLAGILVSLVGSLTVAFVNAWAARRQARVVAHREYLLGTLQPVLDFTEAECDRLEHIGATGLQLDGPDVPSPRVGGIGLVSRTPDLKTSWLAFKSATAQCHELLGNADREREARRSLTPVREQYNEATGQVRRAAIAFRKAVEDHIF